MAVRVRLTWVTQIDLVRFHHRDRDSDGSGCRGRTAPVRVVQSNSVVEWKAIDPASLVVHVLVVLAVLVIFTIFVLVVLVILVVLVLVGEQLPKYRKGIAVVVVVTLPLHPFG